VPDHIRLDASQLDAVIAEFDATPKQALAASKRAIRKTAKFGQGRVARAIAGAHGFPQKALKKRSRVTVSKVKADARFGVSAYIWVGTVPLRASDVGKPRPTRAGVTVGKHKFPGAFVATMASGHTGVFKRQGIKRVMARGRYVGTGILRQEIQEQTVTLPRARAAMESVRDREIVPRLLELMRQELNYEVNVRARARR
jgi:hypothetical protein